MSSNSSSRFQVAVVGGGIVGKACALLLAQQGMQVALAAPRPAAEGARRGGDDWDARIYAFSASSQALLERLRVWEALDPARVQPVRDMRVFGDESAAETDPSLDGDLHFSAYAAAVPPAASPAGAARRTRFGLGEAPGGSPLRSRSSRKLGSFARGLRSPGGSTPVRSG